MNNRNKILYISSLILFSFYFVYDIPSAMNKLIDFGTDNTHEYKLSLLYSAYSFPNILIPLFFGFSQKLDSAKLSNILCIVFSIGHIVFTLGVYMKSFSVMVLGRFILGIGGESFSVIQNKIISIEFRDFEISFSLSIFSSIARLGTITNFLITPILANHYGPVVPCVLGIFLTLKAIILCFFLNRNYIQNIKHLMLPEEEMVLKTENLEAEKEQTSNIDAVFAKKVNFEQHFEEELFEKNSEQSKYLEEFQSKNKDIFFNRNLLQESPFKPWQDTIESQRKDRLSKKINQSDNVDEDKERYEDSGEFSFLIDKNKKLTDESTKQVFINPFHFHEEPKGFPKNLFILFVCVMFCYTLVSSSFYTVAPIIIQKRFNIGIVKSSQLLSIIEMISLVLNLSLSKIVDRYGCRLSFVFIGLILLVLSHVSILLTNVHTPYIPVILLGTSSPFLAVLWSCIPIMISDKHLTKVFSVLSCFLNLAFLISPLIIRAFTKNHKTYFYLELFFILVSILGLAFMALLSDTNREKSHNLNKSNGF